MQIKDQIDPGKSHILIVDDEKSIRDLLRDGVEKTGYECSVASNGLGVLKILEEKGADVVIFDIMMPGMDGIELTRRIQEGYEADVILITDLVKEYSCGQAIDMGVSDFLEKPIGIHELILRVRRVLRERANIRERNRAEKELRDSLEKLRTAMESIVEVMVVVIEKRDPYTSGHQRRVAVLAYAIAQEMGLPRDQIEGIRVAAMIHDIGKILVPDKILNKPGPLTEEEMGMIKEHSKKGYDIIKRLDFPWPVAQIVLQHHERMDSPGYPQGFSGQEIFLASEILNVADVFEAMVSDRPYRQSLGVDKAIEELWENQGVLYDPEVVDTCLRLVNEKGFELA